MQNTINSFSGLKIFIQSGIQQAKIKDSSLDYSLNSFIYEVKRGFNCMS